MTTRSRCPVSPLPFLLTFLLALPAAQAPLSALPKKAPSLHVGIFADKGVGDSPKKAKHYAEDILITLKTFTPQYKIKLITAKDIRRGALKSLDVVIFPGGSGLIQMQALGKAAGDMVRDFVRRGGGFVGICAGAYLARSPLPGSKEKVLSLIPAVLVDNGNYWERGSGIVKTALAGKGKELFPEIPAGVPAYIHYYNGPVLVPQKEDGGGMEVLMTFESDIMRGDPAASSIRGLPFMIRSRFGKGTVIVVSGHPEATPGLRWMLPRMVSLAAAAGGEGIVPYPPVLVKTNKIVKEILYTGEMRKGEQLGLEILWNYSREDDAVVLAFIEELDAMKSRKQTHILPALLKSPNKDIRGAAAAAIDFYEYFPAIPAVKKALLTEQDASVKTRLESALHAILPEPVK